MIETPEASYQSPTKSKKQKEEKVCLHNTTPRKISPDNHAVKARFVVLKCCKIAALKSPKNMIICRFWGFTWRHDHVN